VEFTGREISYVPRVGPGEESARYHEAERTARRLIDERGGRPRVIVLRDAERRDGPTSLAEWILALPKNETRERLRGLFSESPRRNLKDVGEEDEPGERVQAVERWRMHETPRKCTPSRAPVTLSEAVLATLAWPLVYLAAGWFVGMTERLLDLMAYLDMAPEVGTLVEEPTLASAAVATLTSSFVLWRRRTMRVGEARMFAGRKG